jgi:hypothetical protein
MGGDGGVIAATRKFMRGAGTADQTADAARSKKGETDPAIVEMEAARAMTTCALTGKPLDFDQAIVTCPYGRLYQKEAAIEALLRRKEHDAIGEHVRGLKDLYPVRFLIERSVPVCPITGKELNGQIAAFVCLPGGEEVNVLSERALSEMKDLLADYGPIEQKVRLAPPASVMDQVKEQLEQERSKKDKKKINSKKTILPAETTITVTSKRTTTTLPKNDALSSIFTKPTSNLSEKERTDNLFAR